MSCFSPGHPQMMKEDMLPALVRLAKVENAEIKQDVATALCRLSASVELAFDMVDEGLPEALYWLTLEDLLSLNKSVLLRCSVVCRNVVVSDDALRRLASESARFSKVLQRLSVSSGPDLLLNVAMVYLRITGLREPMLAFHRGACQLIFDSVDILLLMPSSQRAPLTGGLHENVFSKVRVAHSTQRANLKVSVLFTAPRHPWIPTRTHPATCSCNRRCVF